jgi:replicative DNA helicase
VLFIYRPEYYSVDDENYGSPVEGAAEIIIAKNRHGSTKDVKLKFIGKYAKFSDLESDFPGTNTISPNTSFDGPKTRLVMSKMDDHDKNEAF